MKGNFNIWDGEQVFSSACLNGCGWCYLILLEPEQATSLSLTLVKTNGAYFLHPHNNKALPGLG